MVAIKDLENFSFRLLLTGGELSLGYIMTIDKSVCFVYDHDTTLRLNFSYHVHVHGGSSVAFFAIIYHIHLCVL